MAPRRKAIYQNSSVLQTEASVTGYAAFAGVVVGALFVGAYRYTTHPKPISTESCTLGASAPAVPRSPSGAHDVPQQSMEQRKAMLDTFQKRFAKAQEYTQQYDKVMTQNPTYGDLSLLQKATKVLGSLEHDIMIGFKNTKTGELKLEVEEARFFLTVLDAASSVYDDMNQPEVVVKYLMKLVEYDKCKLFQTSAAVLEYEYCSGKLWSKIIMHLRHSLNQPEEATKWFNKATAVTYNGQRVHYWPNEWQISTLYMPNLKSQPWWPSTELSIAQFLEEHYLVFKRELLEVLQDKDLQSVFTQNDHSLLTAGNWGEQKLYDGKEWKPVCRVAKESCVLLKSRPELMGTLPTAQTHNVNMPKETGYFRMRPGTSLKPHTGPLNFHLYCHLGLIVPKGPMLKVGNGEPRTWQEGKATCFDDSYVHEAWHEGTEPRYVLMVTFWHPGVGTPTMPSV